MLMDDTVRHVAQVVMDGIGPYRAPVVDEELQAWPDAEGDTGDEANQGEIDDEIEIDLRRFFDVK